MKTIQNTAALFFVGAVIILTVLSIGGVWEIISDDATTKSFQTLGLLAFVAIIVMASGKYMENRSQAAMPVAEVVNPIFHSIRQFTLSVLIVAVTLLALIGVMAIWDVIEDRDVLYNSLSSLGILAFGAFVIVMTCLERENKLPKQGHVSGTRILGYLILAWIAWTLFRFFSYF